MFNKFLAYSLKEPKQHLRESVNGIVLPLTGNLKLIVYVLQVAFDSLSSCHLHHVSFGRRFFSQE